MSYIKTPFFDWQKGEIEKLMANLEKPLTKEEIENMSWEDTQDRGMSESSGFLFKKDIYELRFWTVHPRFCVYKNGKSIYESDIQEKITVGDFKYMDHMIFGNEEVTGFEYLFRTSYIKELNKEKNVDLREIEKSEKILSLLKELENV